MYKNIHEQNSLTPAILLFDHDVQKSCQREQYAILLQHFLHCVSDFSYNFVCLLCWFGALLLFVQISVYFHTLSAKSRDLNSYNEICKGHNSELQLCISSLSLSLSFSLSLYIYMYIPYVKYGCGSDHRHYVMMDDKKIPHLHTRDSSGQAAGRTGHRAVADREPGPGTAGCHCDTGTPGMGYPARLSSCHPELSSPHTDSLQIYPHSKCRLTT